MSIGNTVSSIVNTLVTPTHPNGMSTTSQAIAKGIRRSQLQRILQKVLASLRSESGSDSFSADIACLHYLEGFKGIQSDLFSAMLISSKDDFYKKLAEKADSKDDLSVIQSADDFNINIKPLHEEYMALDSLIDGYKASARENVYIDVLPIADAASWAKAVDFIRRLPKQKAAASDAVGALLGDQVTISAHDSTVINNVKISLNAMAKGKFLSAAIDDTISSIGRSVDERANAAIVGTIDERGVWQSVLARLESVYPEAAILTDMRRAAELSVTSNALLDFSIDNEDLSMMPRMISRNVGGKQTLSEQALEQQMQQRADGQKVISGSSTQIAESKHLAALVAHILLYAGCSFRLTDKATASSQRMDRPLSAVPVEWNVIAPIVRSRTAYFWKAFMPDSKSFASEFFSILMAEVKKNGGNLISVDKLRPRLIKALRSDLENVIKVVRETAETGTKCDVKALIAKSLDSVVYYTDEYVTPFDDQSIQTISGVQDFVNAPMLYASTIRPFGLIAHPSSNGKGFSEALVAENVVARFGAITASISSEEIGKLYNKITDFSDVHNESMSISLRLRDALGTCMYDVARGAYRRSDAKVETLLASEMIVDSKFAKLGEDFHAFVVRDYDDSVLLASGGTATKVKIKNMGNIHGVFSVGSATPKNNAVLSTPFDLMLIEALDAVNDELMMAYAPTAVKIVPATAAKIELKQENDTYVKRISAYGKSFDDYGRLNLRALRDLAGLPTVAEPLRKLITSSLLHESARWSVKAQKEMLTILRLVVGRQVSQFTDAYSPSVLRLFKKSLTTTLNVRERMEMRNLAYSDTIHAMTLRLATLLEGESDMMRAVYLTEFLLRLDSVEVSSDDTSEVFVDLGDEEEEGDE